MKKGVIGRAKIIFLLMFCPTILLSAEFVQTTIARKEDLDEKFFVVYFSVPKEFSPIDFYGSYLEVKKPIKPTHPRIYSITKYPTDDDPIIGITVERTERRVGYLRLSSSLDRAFEGSDQFYIRPRKSSLNNILPEDRSDIIVIAGGNAITRGVGMMRLFSKQNFKKKLFLIHSVNRNKQPLYRDLLEQYPYYALYETGNCPRIHESVFPDVPSYLSLVIDQHREALYVISGPDVTTDAPGLFELNIKDHLMTSGIPEVNIICSTRD